MKRYGMVYKDYREKLHIEEYHANSEEEAKMFFIENVKVNNQNILDNWLIEAVYVGEVIE